MIVKTLRIINNAKNYMVFNLFYKNLQQIYVYKMIDISLARHHRISFMRFKYVIKKFYFRIFLQFIILMNSYRVFVLVKC